MAPINFHIPLGKLRQVQSRIQESVGNSNLRLSVHDCLIAHVVTILNRCLSTPIRFVTHAASYRTVDAPFVESHEAGNAIHIIPTSLNERDAQNVEGIAVALRRSILKWRDPDLLARWLAVASHSMLEAANSDRSMFFAATSGLLSVNSQVS
ncbi:hypothetical protein WOLCODRAFT_66225 [Wolfiporia cocos MD-104 SS10]|uniref:Uncharacterized protein n=1 Tax=Wolfiporia cocos (strain MD-104) TaxID=742152 RepID=A0A2H3JQK7_WOLCO|nr:hypothetical protein WOLCODRAFT_66225 [Wolfiporia cocos MD-104 SS10]